MHRPVVVATVILAGVAIVAALTLVLPGLRPAATVQPGSSPRTNATGSAAGPCATDADCVPAGCSGQRCVPLADAASTVTTCEYRSSFACLTLTACGCVQGSCAWHENAAYAACVASADAQVGGTE